MCCCKIHLHARWTVASLIKGCKDQGISTGNAEVYESFFEEITRNCPDDKRAYINWKCTPNKNTTCTDIISEWNHMKQHIKKMHDKMKTVDSLTLFRSAIQIRKGRSSRVLNLRQFRQLWVTSLNLSKIFCLKLFTTIMNCKTTGIRWKNYTVCLIASDWTSTSWRNCWFQSSMSLRQCIGIMHRSLSILEY